MLVLTRLRNGGSGTLCPFFLPVPAGLMLVGLNAHLCLCRETSRLKSETDTPFIPFLPVNTLLAFLWTPEVFMTEMVHLPHLLMDS